MTGVVGALDIGGTHVSAGRVDVASTAVEPESRTSAPLPPGGGRAELLAAISEVARSIAAPAIDALGVAVPGPFDYERGVSEITHKLDGLHGVELRAELSAAAALPDAMAIRFVNDAEAFLLGEWWAGAARGHARAVGITLGTGLGSAFIDDGEIVRTGARVPPGGELYTRDFRGAPVEETISRAALLARYGVPADDGVDVEQIAQRALAGEPAAASCLPRPRERTRAVPHPVAACVRPDLPRGGRVDRTFLAALRGAAARRAGAASGAAGRQRRRPARRCGAARGRVRSHGPALMAKRRLQPQVEAYLRERRAAGVRPPHQLSVAEAREAETAEPEPSVREPVAEVLDRTIPGPTGEIPVRIYRVESSGPNPALVYFFGGGWVLGSLDAVDPVCRRLANGTPCAVVSVAYRRAPEHTFPAGLEDCYAATCWVAEHAAELGLDPGRLAVGGASAGGNLAAAVALLARERGGPTLAAQLLVYPPLDHRADTPSMHEELDPLLFGARDIAWCWSHYLADPADGDNPLASPLRVEDVGGLPPALVITAELDPLRDEGELYAARLADAGVPAELVRFDGAVHGFFSNAARFDAAVEAQAVAASALRRWFEADDAREGPQNSNTSPATTSHSDQTV